MERGACVVATLLCLMPHLVAAQSFVGTYRHFGSAHEGCAVEVGERKADSVRIQFDCNRGAPSYHHGANDVRVALHNRVAAYTTNEFGSQCSIRFEFLHDRVKLTQTGSDIACGFGAFVNVDGTYPRVSRRPPKFDLLPL